jgi:hypothetical protein
MSKVPRPNPENKVSAEAISAASETTMTSTLTLHAPDRDRNEPHRSPLPTVACMQGTTRRCGSSHGFRKHVLALTPAQAAVGDLPLRALTKTKELSAAEKEGGPALQPAPGQFPAAMPRETGANPGATAIEVAQPGVGRPLPPM